jgi:hypothetical protein
MDLFFMCQERKTAVLIMGSTNLNTILYKCEILE